MMLVVVLELAVYVAAVLFLLEGLALVVVVLASCQMYVEFRAPVLVDEEQRGHYGEAGTLGGLLQAVDLAAVEEQLAVAARSVVVVGAVEILRDVHVLNPHLAADDDAVGVHEAGLAQTDALDLRAGKDEACGVFVHQVVVELRFAVLDVDGFLFLFCHRSWIMGY